METNEKIKEERETKSSFIQKIKNKWKKEADEVSPIVRFLIIIFAILISTAISTILIAAFDVSLISFVIFYVIFYNGFIWIWKKCIKNK